MLAHIQQQAQHIERQAHEIKFGDAKREKVMFELARLKAWKFDARTEAMNAEQHRRFEETMADDEASLQAQLEQLQSKSPAKEPNKEGDKPPRKPRRQKLPEHPRRVDHTHEPDDTNCPLSECGRPMVRVGEDISEQLDIVPAEFFVHRHIYGKWACRCCQCLVQEPVVPQIIDGGIMAAGLIAHTLTSHFVDHLPYYRLESINARAGVHTPRSTLAKTSGRAGAALERLYDAHKRFVLQSRVLHADETPVAMLDPGRGKTKRALHLGLCQGSLRSTAGRPVRVLPGPRRPVPHCLPTGKRRLRRAHALERYLVRDEYSAYDLVYLEESAQMQSLQVFRAWLQDMAKDSA